MASRNGMKIAPGEQAIGEAVIGIDTECRESDGAYEKR